MISVCLLAYNSADYIKTAIESVLAQTFSNWEMLVSDDASSDNTQEIVRPYLRDSRIQYIRHAQNLRQPGNWRYAIEHTNAPYLATLHADDAWEPCALQAFIDAFSRGNDVDLVWANWDYYDADLRQRQRSASVVQKLDMQGESACHWLAKNNHALPSASSFSRVAVVKVGMPDLKYGMLCDRDYFLRLAAVARRSIAIPSVITQYRQHQNSVTHHFWVSGELQKEMAMFCDHASDSFDGLQNGKRVVITLRSQMGSELFCTGLGELLAGNYAMGAKWLRQGIFFAHWRLLSFSCLNNIRRVVMIKVREFL